MFRSPVLIVAILVACVASVTLALPTKIDNQTVIKITTVDDISKFRDLPAGAKLIPLSLVRSNRDLISYTLGDRVSGDEIVSQADDSVTFDVPKNIKLNLKYPSKGTSTAVITFVEILVEQSNNEGQAYVISGGIGKRTIEMVVEASKTTYLNFTSKIYGIQD